MAGFRFALGPLLRQRELEEQTQQRAVAQIERERLALESQIRRRQEAIQSGKDDLREQLVGSVQVENLRGQAGAAMQAMRDAQRLVLELAGVHKRLDTAQQALREAMAKRRALELLRDRRLAEWKARADKREQAMIDDLVAAKAARGAVS